MRKLKIFTIHALVKLMALLPLSLAYRLADLLGTLAYRLDLAPVKVTRKNLSLCLPELDGAERERLTRASLKAKVRTMAEMCKVWLAPQNQVLGYIRAVQGEQPIAEALARSKGVIIVAPHLGNWELLNLYVSTRYPLNILYQRPNMIELDEFIRNARARSGARVHATDRTGVAAIFQALRKGELVGILPDQQPPPEAGVFAPFFGMPTLTMTLVSKLVQKTGAAVFCGYAKRLEGGGFEILFQPADSAIQSEDVVESVAALNRSIEVCVRGAVSQYQWEYKRFKREPGGRTQHYKFK